jgi:hypothetical protein
MKDNEGKWHNLYNLREKGLLLKKKKTIILSLLCNM